MTFFHGVETFQVPRGPRAPRDIFTSAILLVGTAPEGPVQELTLCRNADDAAQFGSQVMGHTIPQALDAIYKQSNALVAVVNVAKNGHYAQAPDGTVTNESVALTGAVISTITNEAATVTSGGQIQLTRRINNTAGVVITDVSGSTTYVLNTDYANVRATGLIDIINPALTTGTVLHVDYQSFTGGSGALAFAPKSGTNPVVTNGTGLITYASGTDYNISSTGVFTSISIPNGTVLVDYTTWEQHVVEDMRFTTAEAPRMGTAVQLASADRATAYVEGVDFTRDAFGNFTVLTGGAITEGQGVQIRYSYFDVSLVTGSDILGGYDTMTETYTGLELGETAYNDFGFRPKLLCIPVHNNIPAVWPEMIVKAEAWRAMALFDSETAWTNSDALTERGSSSTSAFSTGSERVILCYPGVSVVNPDTGENEIRPMSNFVAGLIAKVDAEKGFWFSPSNNPVIGVSSLETKVTWNPQVASTQANALNGVGISTMGKPYGGDWLFWGNRSAAFPTNTTPKNFVSVRRVMDTLHETAEQIAVQFLDRPITNALIADLVESINSYMRGLEQLGALISGECSYDPTKNPPAQIANGQIVLDLDFMPPAPAERIRFESFLNIQRLTALG